MLPSFEFASVAHIGTYPRRPDGPPRLSYEGIGLSVSICPEAWSQIARLGGREQWLRRRDGRSGRFVDGYAVRDDAFTHAEQVGWIEYRAGWRITYFDDEFDEERSYTTTDPADVAEARDSGFEVSEERIPAPAGRLRRRLVEYLGHESGLDAMLDEVVNRYVATFDPEADGVYWDNELDPARLTAPSGIILPERLEAWVEVAGG